MKSTTRNSLIAALILGALSAPLSASAASSAVVNITATVTEKFTVAVDNSDVTFNEGGSAKVKITTTSNAAKHSAAAKLSIKSSTEADGKTVKLKHTAADSSAIYPVDVKIGGSDAAFDKTNNTAIHNVLAPASSNTQETIMEFTSTMPGHAQAAGVYRGTLTITVSPA